MAAYYTNLLMNMFETLHLNKSHKKLERNPVFHWWYIFYLDRLQRLAEINFSILPEIKWNKENEVSYKTWNITIYQNNQILRLLHHPKSANLIYYRLFKIHTRSHLPYPKILSHWTYDQKHVKVTVPTSAKELFWYIWLH